MVPRLTVAPEKTSQDASGVPQAAPTRRPRWMVAGFALTVLVGVGAYYKIIWGSLDGFVTAMDMCDKLFCDFVVYYYEMGRTVLATKVPAPGFFYSPLFAVLLIPFGALEENTASIVWGIVMLLTSAGLGVMSYRTAPPESRATIAGFVLLFVTSFPVLHNFKWGQVSVLLVLLVVASLVAYENKHTILAAILLALAVSIKYYPVVFVVYFIVHRDWKFVVSFVISVVVCVFALPAVVLGPGDTLEFLNRVLLGGGGVQRGAGGPNSQSLKNVLARIYPGSRDTVEAWRVAFTALGYFLLWMNLALVFLLRKLGRHEALTISFMVLFLSIPLFVATSWPHYLVYLPFCQVLAFEMLRQTYEPSRVRRRILASLLGVSVALASVMVFDLMGSWERYTGAGLLFWSNLSLLAFVYLHAVPKILPLSPVSDSIRTQERYQNR